jgi:3-hydroxyacyl-[acyl-carrier-protein] dehydratase
VSFHLVDRFVAWEPGRRVHARKLTSPRERYWEPTAAGPVMPSPLVLEAFGQAGVWLIFGSTNPRRRAALLAIGRAAFPGRVRPGDVLDLEVEIRTIDDEIAVLGGVGRVDGRTVLEADDILCALVPAEDLEDLEDSERRFAGLVGADRPATAGAGAAAVPTGSST